MSEEPPEDDAASEDDAAPEHDAGREGAPPEEGSDPPTDPLHLARAIADSYRGGPPARRQWRASGPTPPRRRSREDPVPLSELMGEVVKQHGWDPRISAQRVFTDWPGIVGPEVAQHTSVAAFDDGVLQVRTDSTAWATQLRLLAPRLVARLNEELGHGSVLRLEVVPPRAPSWKKGGRSVRGRGPRDTYG